MDNISKHSNISDSAAISGILPQTLIGKGWSLDSKRQSPGAFAYAEDRR
jgi:hypothetical protein